MRRYNLIWIYLLATLPACGQQTLDEKLGEIYRHTVPLIQPSDLYEWKEAGKDLAILDIRSDGEYQVSHIEGAELIDFKSFEDQDVARVPKGKVVVVYCSVGYRSERIGEKMKALGFDEVYNLYGGIFQWKNEGYEVVDSEQKPTERVHAYNKNWGKYLKKGIKVYD